jgi:hypothetical protein
MFQRSSDVVGPASDGRRHASALTPTRHASRFGPNPFRSHIPHLAVHRALGCSASLSGFRTFRRLLVACCRFWPTERRWFLSVAPYSVRCETPAHDCCVHFPHFHIKNARSVPPSGRPLSLLSQTFYPAFPLLYLLCFLLDC